MPLSAIVAVAGTKQVIGMKGDMPWHCPIDLKRFKELTQGHTVIMGRVTYESILRRLGNPLPGRKTIVITRDKNFHDDRVQVITDISLLPNVLAGDEAAFVAGGAQIYATLLPLCSKLYLTRIEKEVEGDAFFPALGNEWKLASETTAKEPDGTRLLFCTYANISIPTHNL